MYLSVSDKDYTASQLCSQMDKRAEFAINVLNYMSQYPDTSINIDELLHPNYYGGTTDIPNTWNEIWQTGISELIDYSSGITPLLTRIKIYHDYLGNIKYEILEVFSSEEKIMIRAMLHFNYIKAILGYPYSGQRISIESFNTFTFTNGLISNWKVNIDFYQWLKAIGGSLRKEGSREQIEDYIESLKSQKIIPEFD